MQMTDVKYYRTNKRYFKNILANEENKTNSTVVPFINNTEIKAVYEDKNYIGVCLKSTTKSTDCAICGKKIKTFKQYKTTYPTVARVNDKNIILELRSKQYYCPDCRKHTTEPLIEKEKGGQKSYSFIKSMLKSLKETVSYSAIARTYKQTVSGVIYTFDKIDISESQKKN